jgi:hypothetical protein
VNIIGPDFLVFGVEDMDTSKKMALDYGLTEVESGQEGGIYEAMDGTGMIIKKSSDNSLAKAVASDPNIREVIYGVRDQQTIDEISVERSKDRDVTTADNGRICSIDDDGYPISFQVSIRHTIDAPHYGVNVPGQEPGRGINEIGNKLEDPDLRPRSLSHVVKYTKDKVRAEKFYAERLRFRTTDSFIELGPFMRPAGTNEHHTLFFIQTPFLGLNHFTFHFAGAHELFKAGWEFNKKGYKTAWGPGRHYLGSNYFWYLNSPFGGWMEFDADMDLHDDNWQARNVHAGADNTQAFLFKYADKWSPSGKPNENQPGY